MGKLQRLKIIESQSRAFLTGTAEKLNDEWVFFDDECDEASMLDDYLDQEIEFHGGQWKKGF
ncbi:hypothetical protein BpJC7_21740 [Weizmannia acidilactici]|uniref:Uncharacterized protein n=1 Tax=Weizmannia acidilactici TaxID=2607726 RepID=A0A5J4JGN8_9BACI|nr:DUF2777 family protein [Weizmannia acidilactici]GER65758.1 hypothetical protein BpJC4_02290 [Weizmannia acidilactici]GER70871.1 hypothetical protein BpJC7_21740 [Weizmannia acidilactici]GER72662.1 hypothetical protein BpPP18_07290 [Weizmannia acidilactici]